LRLGSAKEADVLVMQAMPHVAVQKNAVQLNEAFACGHSVAPVETGISTVSILVISYNTRDMTLACLRSVFEQTTVASFEVIVVDNASGDESADAIEREFPQVRLIRSADNLGFAVANNLAARNARGNFLLLLNPDTLVLDHAIDRLMAFAGERPNARIWGGRTLFGDGSLNPASCWRFMSLWSLFTLATGLTSLCRDSRLFNPEGYGGWRRDCVREVEIVTGCLLLIRRDLWDKLGGFDGSFFMYGEEADLCYRARELGIRPMMTPDATIIHYDGASDRMLSAKMTKLLSGKILFMRKHWSWPRRTAGIVLLELLVLARVLRTSLMAFVLGSRLHAAAQEWRQVWMARDRWTKGYSPLAR
jgi:N-acetylglucosaminyl-diphospho-decaprenol L-rhamnosyltransferase